MIVIFTDLDGTLLDANSYSWEAARPALDRIAQQNVPLVMVSSKTRAEIEVLRRETGNTHPFVVENGGAAFIPKGYFGFPAGNVFVRDGYEILQWGTPYAQLVESLNAAAIESRCPVTGFHHFSIEEISGATGLTLEQAALAVEREFDEPFLVPNQHMAASLLAAIERRGLRWTHGGRFYHICGDNDKATAVGELARLYAAKYGEVTTVALGDSLNDVPMLMAVDIPVLVRTHAKPPIHFQAPGARRTRHAGPDGWNEAVMELLDAAEAAPAR